MNTFVEAARQRFFAFLVLLGAGMAGAGVYLRAFDFGGSELKFVADFGFGGMFLFGAILAVVLPAQVFFSEMDNRTALPLLARPVRRWEFLAGKFFGVWVLLGVFVVLLGCVLGVMLRLRAGELAVAAVETGREAPFLSEWGLVVFCLLQWLRLGVVAALGVVVCSFARSFLYAVVVTALAALVCQLRGMGQVAFAREDAAGWVRVLAGGAGRMVPDLQVFDLGVPLVLQPGGVAWEVVASAAGHGALYLPVLLGLGVWFFVDREI
ncbi:MAG: ABC transporter permease [Puniceicoccales bacterium]|nr:ABC transporter permease [Puniceicoccales bacterium]